jgi:hypothetical protein
MLRFGRIFDRFVETFGGPHDRILEDEDGLGSDDLLDDLTPLGPRAHYRHNGRIFSRQQSHAGNSLIAYESQGRIKHGTIQGIEVLKSQDALLHVIPYVPYPDNHKDRFSCYAPHFPARLLTNKEGNIEDVPISAVKCHCARYHVSEDSVLMLELARVSVFIETAA